jgi:imidazolonepropionase
MRGLPATGPIRDDQLELIVDGGILVTDGTIGKTGAFDELLKEAIADKIPVEEIEEPAVVMPGLIDCHTHACFAGNRSRDYALRVSGMPYLEIAKRGGGILDTVEKTRAASEDELTASLRSRCDRMLSDGITTCEVKSGYGLNLKDEVKMLKAIHRAGKVHAVDLVATCLAAHVRPREFSNDKVYLDFLVTELLPKLIQEGLARRVDAFVDHGAFDEQDALAYLNAAKRLGFSVTVHADQFKTGGSLVAAETGAVSADHLEASGDDEFAALKKNGVIAVALPGASLGLGMGFAPARKILDTGLSLAIASDWNPGSAPMGDLLMQAAVLGAHQKLSTAETLAALTARAGAALELPDRGIISGGMKADFILFPTDDYRDILYHQGRLKPAHAWKNGTLIF